MKKLNYLKVLFAFMFFAFAVQSCKSDDDNANYQMENQTFVTQALTNNKFEVAAATLAQSKSQNAQIKQFAGKMISEHTAMGVDLTDLAKSMELAIPANIEQADQDNINALGLYTGATFDKEFTRMMVASHEKAVTLFSQAASNTGVPAADLRHFAETKTPSLQQHLKEAQALQTAAQ
jgi:putative membrane protein